MQEPSSELMLLWVMQGGQQGGSAASPSSPADGEDEQGGAGREGASAGQRQSAMQMTSPGAGLLPPANAENGFSWQQRTEGRDLAPLPVGPA